MSSRHRVQCGMKRSKAVATASCSNLTKGRIQIATDKAHCLARASQARAQSISSSVHASESFSTENKINDHKMGVDTVMSRHL